MIAAVGAMKHVGTYALPEGEVLGIANDDSEEDSDD